MLKKLYSFSEVVCLYVDDDLFASSTEECILKNMDGQNNVDMKNCF